MKTSDLALAAAFLTALPMLALRLLPRTAETPPQAARGAIPFTARPASLPRPPELPAGLMKDPPLRDSLAMLAVANHHPEAAGSQEDASAEDMLRALSVP